MTSTPQDPAAFWDARYAESDRIWSGRANAALVDTVTGLAPGRALDLGCGEGGDSVWLATHGWHVTGVDISPRAVERARTLATEAGLSPDAVDWQVEDLATWRPTGTFELVTACFLHSAVEFPRDEVLRRAAGAVVPGGHLLVVGHAAPPPWSRLHEHRHELRGPQDDLAALALDPAAWETVVCDLRRREAVGPDGRPGLLDDSVVLLRRR